MMNAERVAIHYFMIRNSMFDIQYSYSRTKSLPPGSECIGARVSRRSGRDEYF